MLWNPLLLCKISDKSIFQLNHLLRGPASFLKKSLLPAKLQKKELTHSAINFNLQLLTQKSICSKFSADYCEFFPRKFAVNLNFLVKKAHDNFPKIVIYLLGKLIFFLVCEGNSMRDFGGKFKYSISYFEYNYHLFIGRKF
jgi:hypothetical protein